MSDLINELNKIIEKYSLSKISIEIGYGCYFITIPFNLSKLSLNELINLFKDISKINPDFRLTEIIDKPYSVAEVKVSL